MYHDDNVKIPVGLKKPVVFASFKSIYSYLANGGEVLDIFQKGATCCFPTSYRSGQISKPIHTRSYSRIGDGRILYNQFVVHSFGHNGSFGFKGDSGAWVYGLNEIKKDEVAVVGVLNGGGATENSSLTFICSAEKLNEKYSF